MKFIIPILVLFSSFAFASDYNGVTNQLTIDESGLVVDGPRGPSQDPIPFTEPRPGRTGDERNPYRDPDDAPDYQREDERLAVQNYGDPDPDRPWEHDSRFKGVICQAILAQHSRWH